MKRYLITFAFCFAAAALFAQDMSNQTRQFTRTDGTFSERLELIETVRATGATGIGDFYHAVLKYAVLKNGDIKTQQERTAAEKTAVIICQGIAAENVSGAAAELWQIIEAFDIGRSGNEGDAMREAAIALGKIDGRDYLPRIVQRLNNFNSQTYNDLEAKKKVQKVVVGFINTLELFKDISGYRPVFNVYSGSYDPPIREIAAKALPNITDDPSDVVIEIIQDPSTNAHVKLMVWNEMLKTKAPASSKAKAAAAALATGWNYTTSDLSLQSNLTEMRKGAIDAIRIFGASDASVYLNLKKSYDNNFINNAPDFIEIQRTLETLAALKTDESVGLLLEFLKVLHERRRSGPWARKERDVLVWVIKSLGATGTSSMEARLLLNTIGRDSKYTNAENKLAQDALKLLGK